MAVPNTNVPGRPKRLSGVVFGLTDGRLIRGLPPDPTDEPGEDQPAPVQEPAKGDDQADGGGG